jgi:hypothetical protein
MKCKFKHSFCPYDGDHHDLRHVNGWINLEGEFVGCDNRNHAECITYIYPDEPNPEYYAEQQGWIKISINLEEFGFILTIHKMTQKQHNTIFDWCNIHKVKFPQDRCDYLLTKGE